MYRLKPKIKTTVCLQNKKIMLLTSDEFPRIINWSTMLFSLSPFTCINQYKQPTLYFEDKQKGFKKNIVTLALSVTRYIRLGETNG